MSDGRCPYCFSPMGTAGCTDIMCRGGRPGPIVTALRPGESIATLRAERDALRATEARLRGALEKIALGIWSDPGKSADIARAALSGSPAAPSGGIGSFSLPTCTCGRIMEAVCRTCSVGPAAENAGGGFKEWHRRECPEMIQPGNKPCFGGIRGHGEGYPKWGRVEWTAAEGVRTAAEEERLIARFKGRTCREVYDSERPGAGGGK